jgi:nitrate/nitrite transporter NarK
MTMACLIIAGETIFMLPFFVQRFFKATMLEVFRFTNTQLGVTQAAYGVVAMIAYFFGGPLADRYSERRLMTVSLVLTSVGGLYFATIPGYLGMAALFGFFGLTTILLFWAALISATRHWGGPLAQGRAYGLLDGGRGLVAFLLSRGAYLPFKALLGEDPERASQAQRVSALRAVVLIYAAATLLTAILVWFFVPERRASAEEERPSLLHHIATVLRKGAIWLQSAIIVCAYVAYKGIDNYSLFAVQGYRMNEVEGAHISTMASGARPIACVGAGLLGDRISSSRVILLSFAILVASYLFFAVDDPGPRWVLWSNVLVSCSAAFALRGVYFALFEEASIPGEITGTAVGVVSIIGYTPDVFFYPVTGWLLDRTPGLVGHQHFFWLLLGFALLGLLATGRFRRSVHG